MNPEASNKPWAESCDQNRQPILEVLRQEFTEPGELLEIGSGTGQHAVYFSPELPHIVWHPSDVAENIGGIELWRREAGLSNVKPAVVLDVAQHWPDRQYDYVFSANTAHILSWPLVEKMIAGVGDRLGEDGKFCLYGPFNRDGQFTSDSNRRFDQWLKSRDPFSGVRDIEDVRDCAENHSLRLAREYAMPANNLTLVFQKISP